MIDDDLRQARYRGAALDRARLAGRGRPGHDTANSQQRREDYLAVRRSLGFDLSFAERVLRGFTAFADREGADHVTVDLFLRWKERFGTANNNTWSADSAWCASSPAWLQGYDARTEVPPAGLIPGKLRRPGPTSTPRPRLRHRCTRGKAAVLLRHAGLDLLDPVRADRGHRVAHQRSHGARRR